jgi:pyruvate formate lyase activating enzyme
VETIGKIIAEKSQDTVSRWDLLAFNNLCKDKYFRLGLDWKLSRAELLTRETMEELANAARLSGVNPAIVQWSGSTRLEEGEQKEIMHPQAKPVRGC